MIAQVEAVGSDGRVIVTHDGRREAVAALTLPTADAPLRVGEWVVIQSGFALERISEPEARDALEIRRTRPQASRRTWEVPE
ncbi:HypC/HybG/HupF family hydrogenase formation chaperone [Demequina sp. NBRC 110052]|uniref:HypC/HybG/HupF family hydrogenase formation chaperone n=1 Tax=Demequina sp. NBRC 110052 TaxID=1570341 RepID=UPI0013564EF4|nr:HypC/HybG/HupF family hydrogenase formation chaperone [Demequina sp. NBRC 110052]